MSKIKSLDVIMQSNIDFLNGVIDVGDLGDFTTEAEILRDRLFVAHDAVMLTFVHVQQKFKEQNVDKIEIHIDEPDGKALQDFETVRQEISNLADRLAKALREIEDMP